jgi:hypothetical protein
MVPGYAGEEEPVGFVHSGFGLEVPGGGGILIAFQKDRRGIRQGKRGMMGLGRSA